MGSCVKGKVKRTKVNVENRTNLYFETSESSLDRKSESYSFQLELTSIEVVV